MTEPTPNQHWYWRLPRPTMMWTSLALPFLAISLSATWPVVMLAMGYPALLYFMRGSIDKGWIERIVSIWKGRAYVQPSQ